MQIIISGDAHVLPNGFLLYVVKNLGVYEPVTQNKINELLLGLWALSDCRNITSVQKQQVSQKKVLLPW
ncbi:hypothetical protein chiPu_0000833 [Chiloscyllium punctatum]|uniref:Uncharacterized protein n=1 Tax=Chiloscyllium punctatum TaxID=137246 RepID=A0A401RWC6_CHIPU|nr:hypothetical protein [Chiloscyllium punctatum]